MEISYPQFTNALTQFRKDTGFKSNLELMNALGFETVSHAYRSGNLVFDRMREFKEFNKKFKFKKEKGERKCLKCDRFFKSKSEFNRICYLCKSVNSKFD